MLNKSGIGTFVLFQNLEDILSVTIMSTMVLWYTSFITLKYVPFTPSFFKGFVLKAW